MSEEMIEDRVENVEGAASEAPEAAESLMEEPVAPAGEETESVSELVTEPLSDETAEPAEDAETFPRAYVEKLRKEAAGHRDRAKRADEFAQRLHTALVEATGRLADARDLPYDETHLDDPAALTAAIEGLLMDKPHLASRKPMGDIGQGATPVGQDVSLAGILRAGAK